MKPAFIFPYLPHPPISISSFHFTYRLISSPVWFGLLLAVSSYGAALDPLDVLDREKMQPAGQWYEASVPDTLDLAKRAGYSINILTHNVDPANHYALWNTFIINSDPPGFHGPTWNLPCKNVRALPLLRTMCGSEQNLDIEFDLMRELMSAIHDDGLLYYVIDGYGAPKDTSYPMTNGIMATAMVNWHHRDGNPDWLNWLELLGIGLKNHTITVDDRAYYPPECGIKLDGSWHWTTRGEANVPYTPPEEPYMDQQGHEGAVKFEQYPAIVALVKCFQYKGDRGALEMARRIARFCLKPGMWEDTGAKGYPGHEHGIFAGHFHGNLTSLHALLDLAVAEDDDRLKQLVREAYNHARRNGVIRMGWIPSFIQPANLQYPRKAFYHNTAELCAVSDLLILAVKLSDAGLGDYWDDVDAIVRNQLTEQQIIDLDLMRGISGGGDKNDDVLKRYIGGFGHSSVTASAPFILGCCAANGATGLYYAWHGITRFDSGVATVNLFLNRASTWMDVDSYLPYEGKVVLLNKKAHTALVRIPGWIESEAIQCFINGEAVRPGRSGSYLVFQNLDAADTIRLEFPVHERMDSYTLGVDLPDDEIVERQNYKGKEYTVTFRGSTVVDIEPRDTRAGRYPLYRRDHLKAGQAPIRRVKRFAADKIIPLP